MEGPEQLDLTSEGLAEDQLITFPRRASSPTVAMEAHRLERMREEQRGRIAGQLIILLLLAVFATVLLPVFLVFLFSGLYVESPEPIQDTISVMQAVGTTVVTPLVGLIGAVIGFYFGTPRGGTQPPTTLPTGRDER